MEPVSARPERPAGVRGWHYRLYDWVLHWAGHPRAQTALFLMALAEASFFPVPPDTLLIGMGLSKPKRVYRFAAVCSIGSVIGGVVGYLIGWGLWEMVQDAFYRWVPGFTPELYERVSGLYDEWNFWVVFAAGFTPIPYKVFTIAAGVAKIGFPMFLIASAISRTARFYLVALLIRLFGERAKRFIERWLGWLTIAFVVLLMAGFYLLRYLH